MKFGHGIISFVVRHRINCVPTGTVVRVPTACCARIVHVRMFFSGCKSISEPYAHIYLRTYS